MCTSSPSSVRLFTDIFVLLLKVPFSQQTNGLNAWHVCWCCIWLWWALLPCDWNEVQSNQSSSSLTDFPIPSLPQRVNNQPAKQRGTRHPAAQLLPEETWLFYQTQSLDDICLRNARLLSGCTMPMCGIQALLTSSDLAKVRYTFIPKNMQETWTYFMHHPPQHLLLRVYKHTSQCSFTQSHNRVRNHCGTAPCLLT